MSKPEFPTTAQDWDIEATRKDLAHRLDSVRSRPGFPMGDDSAIIDLSLPPFHTACPNPYLADWIEQSKKGDGEEREDPGPFVVDVSVGKGNAFYKAHSYPTKVPYPAIMRFLLHYTKPGDLVLDGFAGSGSAGVAAQACGEPGTKLRREIEDEMGKVLWGYRRAILSDLSPSASVISAGLNLPVDGEEFDRKSSRLLDRFDEELGWMYETTHSNGQTARIDYTVWSEVFTCPECGSAVVFYDAAYDHLSGKVVEPFRCPGRNAVRSWTRITLTAE